jgi:hypothetical protein
MGTVVQGAKYTITDSLEEKGEQKGWRKRREETKELFGLHTDALYRFPSPLSELCAQPPRFQYTKNTS